MPPRKSTDSRKSEVTTARFAPKEDAVPQDQSATPPTATPVDSSTVPAVATEADSSSVAEKKDKDKDHKDKDKDKDKGDPKDAVTIEELTLPKSIITRLAKGVLPPNTQIQGNAILALSKSTTVFINYLASYANEHTVGAGKKTVLPADVFKALEDTEFAFFRERLEAEFAKFNAIQTEKRTSYRNKVKAAKQDGASQPGDSSTLSAATKDDTEMADTTLGAASESSAPRAKKARIDPTSARAGDEQDDAETEDEAEHVEDDEEAEAEDGDEDEEDEDDEGPGGEVSGDDTQDAIEERNGGEELDEALDGDESD